MTTDQEKKAQIAELLARPRQTLRRPPVAALNLTPAQAATATVQDASATTTPRWQAPPYPSTAVDCPRVREAWERAHRDLAAAVEALADPEGLARIAANITARERFLAPCHGRKPSGDLRRPVARDFEQQLLQRSIASHQSAMQRAQQEIEWIESGDVVGVEPDEAASDHHCLTGSEGSPFLSPGSVPVPGGLIRQSVLEREAASKTARAAARAAEATRWASLTSELQGAEIAAQEAKEMAEIEAMLAALPPEKPQARVTPLPSGHEPTDAEVFQIVREAVGAARYEARAEQIARKAAKDAETRERTAARRVAEALDPEGSEAARLAQHRRMARNRQRKASAALTPEQRREKERLKKQRQREKARQGTNP